jgi:hypothetical protein
MMMNTATAEPTGLGIASSEVERAMSVLNVGLQGVALSREQRVGGCGVTIWGG